MSIDLNTLSPADLDTLITTAEKRKGILKTRKPMSEVREKLARIASREHYTLDELFPAGTAANDDAPKATTKRASKGRVKRADKVTGKRGRATKASKSPAIAPKYRNPSNADETWSGRGKPPRWMSALLSEGKSKDEFLI